MSEALSVHLEHELGFCAQVLSSKSEADYDAADDCIGPRMCILELTSLLPVVVND